MAQLCSICTKIIEETSMVQFMCPSQHPFHDDCLAANLLNRLSKQRNVRCPYCREAEINKFPLTTRAIEYLNEREENTEYLRSTRDEHSFELLSSRMHKLYRKSLISLDEFRI